MERARRWEQEAGWLHFFCMQQIRREQEVDQGYKEALLPPAEGSLTSPNTTTSWRQSVLMLSLWGKFHNTTEWIVVIKNPESPP